MSGGVPVLTKVVGGPTRCRFPLIECHRWRPALGSYCLCEMYPWVPAVPCVSQFSPAPVTLATERNAFTRESLHECAVHGKWRAFDARDGGGRHGTVRLPTLWACRPRFAIVIPERASRPGRLRRSPRATLAKAGFAEFRTELRALLLSS